MVDSYRCIVNSGKQKCFRLSGKQEDSASMYTGTVRSSAECGAYLKTSNSANIEIKSHRRPLVSGEVPLLFIHHHEFMAASSTDISRQLRLLLTNSPDAPALSSFLETVDALVAECLHSQNSAGLLEQLEEDTDGLKR